jgi:hypothetical protein
METATTRSEVTLEDMKQLYPAPNVTSSLTGKVITTTKFSKCLDLGFLYADTILELFKLKVNRYVPQLHDRLFVQNQRSHDVDVRRFYYRNQEEEKGDEKDS